MYTYTTLACIYNVSMCTQQCNSVAVILYSLIFIFIFQTEDSHQRLLSSGSSNTEREAKETASESRECLIIH